MIPDAQNEGLNRSGQETEIDIVVIKILFSFIYKKVSDALDCVHAHERTAAGP